MILAVIQEDKTKVSIFINRYWELEYSLSILRPGLKSKHKSNFPSMFVIYSKDTITLYFALYKQIIQTIAKWNVRCVKKLVFELMIWAWYLKV